MTHGHAPDAHSAVAHGVVRCWYVEDGWGVLDSEATTGGCWAHFSVVAMDGYRTLRVGEQVSFRWEAAEQDGYAYRAVRVWRGEEPPPVPEEQGSAAMHSVVRLTFGPPATPPAAGG